jgi:hypothetical protein
MSELSPDEELTREVYAYFGLAYYMTECIHRGLVGIYAMHPYSPANAARPRLEERMKAAEQMTLGELVTMTRQYLTPALHESLDWSLATRNFLAHGFWYDRAHMMLTNAGKQQMLKELQLAVERFSTVNAEIDHIMMAYFERLGITPQQFEEAMHAAAQNGPDPSPEREIPRTEEAIEIIGAWTIERGNRSSLVMQSASGELWQLCDVGLGWAYGAPDDSWKPVDKLLLPAKIIARPKRAKMWNYKLHVSTGALICVEPDDGATFTWDIRPDPKP